MFKKKPIPDPEDLDKFRKEAQTLQDIEDGIKTPFGQYVIRLLDEYRARAVKEFSNRPISDMDDMQIMAWTYSIRGKIQLLNDIEQKLLSAKVDKEALMKELKQYSI